MTELFTRQSCQENGKAARRGQTRNVDGILIRKPEEMIQTEDLVVLGRIKLQHVYPVISNYSVNSARC
jgi:hypothetical protein